MRCAATTALMVFLLLRPVQAESLVLDETVPLTLRAKGELVTTPVILPRSAVVTLVLIGPEDAVAGVQVRVRAGDETIDLRRPKLLPAGEYAVDVRAARDLMAAPTLRLTGTVPVDAYEPNDSREQAAKVSPPVRALIQLEGEHRDWFRIDADETGILSLQFHRPVGGPDIYFSVTDGEGHELWRCKEQWDWQGARYFAVERGRSYFISVGQGGGGERSAEMELGLYRPQDLERDEESGRILVVGLDTDSPDLAQLKLIAEATALPLTARVAEDVQGMTDQLVQDVTEIPEPPAVPPSTPTPRSDEEGGPPWPLLAGGVLLLIAAAAAFLRHRRG